MKSVVDIKHTITSAGGDPGRTGKSVVNINPGNVFEEVWDLFGW